MEKRRIGQNWFVEECIRIQRVRYNCKATKEKRVGILKTVRNGGNLNNNCIIECGIRSKSGKRSSSKKESSDGHFEINERKRQDSKTISSRKNVRGKSGKTSRIRIPKKNFSR